MKRDDKDRGGNAAVIVLIVLLLAGAACWYLFRETGQPALPSAETKGVPAAKTGQPGAGNQSVNELGEIADGQSAGAAGIDGESMPMTEQGEVDWDLRRAQLKEIYSGQFAEPKIGADVKALLRSGRTVQGRITDLNKDSVTIRITGTGKATYQRGQLSPASQLVLFKDVFVNYSAERDLTAEKKAREAAMSAVPQ